MKKVLIITQYFFPEQFKSNDLAFELKNRGYDVTVLCGIPNYPKGNYFSGYGIFKKRKEIINGVKIIRVIQSPRKNTRFLLILNYITFVIFGILKVLSLKSKFDIVFIHQPSPITQAIPAILAKKVFKSKLFIWVLDLWPDAVISGAKIKNKNIISAIDTLVNYVYSKCDKILVSSKGFINLIKNKNVNEEKLIYFPNWSEKVFEDNNKNFKIPKLPDGFKIIFAGNFGVAQDFDSILKTCLLLRQNDKIKFIFIGEGSQKKHIKNYIEKEKLSKTVYLYEKYPLEAMPSFYAKADLLLISLKANFPHLEAVVPAKLQSYMSSGKAIIGMINGGAKDIIMNAKCGKTVDAGDFNNLSKQIVELYENEEELNEMGNNGKQYYDKYFKKEICFDNLETIINEK